MLDKLSEKPNYEDMSPQERMDLTAEMIQNLPNCSKCKFFIRFMILHKPGTLDERNIHEKAHNLDKCISGNTYPSDMFGLAKVSTDPQYSTHKQSGSRPKNQLFCPICRIRFDRDPKYRRAVEDQSRAAEAKRRADADA